MQQIRGPQDCTAGCTTHATAINNVGVVTGDVWYPSSNGYRAIRWSDGDGVVDMGDLHRGNNASRGYAINELGWIAGQSNGRYTSHPRFGNQGFAHATLCKSPTEVIEFEDLPGGTQQSVGRGINDAAIGVGYGQTSWSGGSGARAMY